MKAADLFCGAGGAGWGLDRAGFTVTGFDIRHQPRYPLKFYQADALTVDLSPFDFVWASPPCQRHCRLRKMNEAQGVAKDWPDLIAQTRAKLRAWGGPYVIENVPGAPLINPIQLCGSSFGLQVQRHRLFESNIALLELDCLHGRYEKDKPPLHRLQSAKSRVVGCYGNGRGAGDTVRVWQKAMGIDWMTRPELAQAIPPAYSHFIGHQVMRWLREQLAQREVAE